MLKRFLLALLGVSLFNGIIFSQQETIDWPPASPESIFAPNLEIVSSRQESSILDGIWSFNTELRLIRLNDGRLIPFPEGFGFVWYTMTDRVSDRLYLASILRDNTDYPYHSDEILDSIWVFDLNTGEYSRLDSPPETIDSYCGEIPYNHSGNGTPWIIISDSNNQYLCNLSTGLTSEELPNEYSDWQWINYSTFISAVRDEQATMFYLDPLTAELLLLGDFERGQSQTYIPIADEKFTLLLSYDDGNGITSYKKFYIDIVRPSFIEIAPEMTYYENPSRLEAHYPSAEHPDSECRFLVLNLETLIISERNQSTSCEAEFQNKAGDLYYRVVNADGTEASVVRQDAQTYELTTLFTGEIEAIDWISEDERYAAFVLDDSGMIDVRGDITDRDVAHRAKLTLLDLSNGTILYEVDTYKAGIADARYPVFGESFHSVLMIDYYNSYELLTIEGDTVSTSRVDGYFSGSFGNDWTFLLPAERRDEYGNIASLAIYNVYSHETIPLINLSTANPHYYIEEGYSYLGNNLFEFKIRYFADPYLEEIIPLYDRMVYQVHLIEPEIDNP